MFEILSYDFITRALIAGFFCAVVAGVLGNFIIASRQAIISDMLAHSSLAGVGLAVLLSFNPSIFAASVAIFSSLFLYYLSRKEYFSKEAVSVLILSNGIAIALLCVHLAKNNPVSLENYLFGSILTISPQELNQFLILSLFVLVVTFLFYNNFLSLSFDKEFFKSREKHAEYYEILLLILVAVFVSFSLKIIGGLLISSLLIVPVLSSQKLAKSFRVSVLVSIIFNILGILLGILSSFYFDIPTSSAIVLSLTTIFLLVLLLKR